MQKQRASKSKNVHVRCTSAVVSKYSKIECRLVMDKVYCIEKRFDRFDRFVKSLKSGCTGGHDGIISERLKLGVESPEFVHYISTLVTVCLRFGVVPESFRKVTLIPVLNKTTSDPTVASNYQPLCLPTIPFGVLFYKAAGVLSWGSWRVLYSWYNDMSLYDGTAAWKPY